jgi:methionyl-tRNA formyltransferase
MKIIIFSTDTKHHTYFINRISEYYDVCSVIYERKKLVKPYDTGPFWEEEEDEFEEIFFEEGEGVNRELEVNKKMIEVHSVNSKHLVKYIKSLNPDLGILFGTGLVKPYIFDIPKYGTINIHRGAIGEYRGIDSDLWALYNKKFDKINVTIHYVDEKLDTGDVLDEQNCPFDMIQELHEIRYYTTCLATEMMLTLLGKFQSGGRLKGVKQTKLGKYYSAMPIEKKWEVQMNFDIEKGRMYNE